MRNLGAHHRTAFAFLANRVPPLKPAAKRLVRLTGLATGQETLHADIFIQVGPVYPLATRDQPPVGALLRRPMRQTREPRERHRDRSAIHQVRYQGVVTYAYVLGKCISEFTPRNTHAMTSIPRPRFLQPIFGYVQSPPGPDPGFPPSVPVPAKTSLFPLPVPHAHEEAHLDPPSKRKIGMAPPEERLATIPVYMAIGVPVDVVGKRGVNIRKLQRRIVGKYLGAGLLWIVGAR